MCMKYVNATTTCFKKVVIDNGKIVSFNAPFNSIKTSENNEDLVIDDFSIVTQIDFLGTSNEEHFLNNPLIQKKKIDFIIRLTKCNKDAEKRICKDLDVFSLDLKDMYEKKQESKACFDFLNYTRITNVNSLILPEGRGRYVIKVLIKDSEDEEYTIQSMAGLVVV